MLDLIVSVPDHCLSFYFEAKLYHNVKFDFATSSSRFATGNFDLDTPGSKAVFPVLFLILCSFVVYTTGCLVF